MHRQGWQPLLLMTKVRKCVYQLYLSCSALCPLHDFTYMYMYLCLSNKPDGLPYVWLWKITLCTLIVPYRWKLHSDSEWSQWPAESHRCRESSVSYILCCRGYLPTGDTTWNVTGCLSTCQETWRYQDGHISFLTICHTLNIHLVTTIFNTAPGVKSLGPDHFSNTDILCLNETEVSP